MIGETLGSSDCNWIIILLQYYWKLCLLTKIWFFFFLLFHCFWIFRIIFKLLWYLINCYLINMWSCFRFFRWCSTKLSRIKLPSQICSRWRQIVKRWFTPVHWFPSNNSPVSTSSCSTCSRSSFLPEFPFQLSKRRLLSVLYRC